MRHLDRSTHIAGRTAIMTRLIAAATLVILVFGVGVVPVSKAGHPGRFLTLPFPRHASMGLQQGWIYTYGGTHSGVDYIKGTLDNSATWVSFSVLAAAGGTAVWAENPRDGKYVFITHNVNGSIMHTYYGHLSSVAAGIPKRGSGSPKRVGRGDFIGNAGKTGTRSNGYLHLHFALKNNADVAVDPYDIYGTRNRYPAPNAASGTCGDHNFWTRCPTGDAIGDPDDNRILISNPGVSGTISPANDQDTYYFDAGAGQSASLRMNAAPGSGVDSFLKLFRPDGTLLTQNDDETSSTHNSFIENIALPGPGRYRVVAHSWNAASTGVYYLQLALASGTGCDAQTYTAHYFNNSQLGGNPAIVRCEGWPINFDWGTGGPGPGVGVDDFSARWTGRANFDAGCYFFHTRADDGIRLYIDEVLVINAWFDQVSEDRFYQKEMTAGPHTIRVDYYELGGLATAYFEWDRGCGS